MTDQPRTCEQCGDTYTRSPNRPRSEFAKSRFCSKPCAAVAGRRQRDLCKAELHEMTGDNVRVDLRGHRSCKACAADRERERKGRKRRRPVQRRAPRAKPASTPADIPPAPAPVDRPVWRPAGFAAQPNTRRSA